MDAEVSISVSGKSSINEVIYNESVCSGDCVSTDAVFSESGVRADVEHKFSGQNIGDSGM